MKKIFYFLVLVVTCMLYVNTIFAGQWKKDSGGWWYQNDNGSYPKSCWQWIDGNNDNYYECYYFDYYGYCVLGPKTIDGYQIDNNGAWVVNGVVQKKSVGPTSSLSGISSNNSYDSEKTFLNNSRTKMNLASLQVTTKSSYVNIVDSDETMLDGSFGKCIVFRNSVGSGNGSLYIEFYLGYNYDALNLTYAPRKGMKEDNVGIIEVYGDDVEGDLLFESEDINYRTHSKTVNIDVSNCEFVRIKYGCNTSWDHGNVLIKGSVE